MRLIQVALLVALLATQVTGAYAQASPAPATHSSNGQLLQQLDLTPEQKAQIKTAVHNNKDPKARRAAVMAILTADQKRRLHQLMISRKSGRPARTPAPARTLAPRPVPSAAPSSSP